MKKTIFIIESEFYSLQLLNNYVEKHTNFRAFNFFNAEETLLYMGLEPSIIVYSSNDPAFTPRQLTMISNSLAVPPVFLAVNKESVVEFQLMKGDTLTYVGKEEYHDIYQNLQEYAESFGYVNA